MLSIVGWLMPASASANPIGPSGLQGVSDIQGLGSAQVIINQSAPKAILNWQQFNIAPGEVTRFVQPSTAALALNRIADLSPSQIFGSLQANGSVILLNPNGVMFGPNAQINVNGLIASSLNLSDENFLNGMYRFEGAAIAGAVRNAGTIETGVGGFVYLLAPNVENSGVIRTPEGHITLAAGTTAYLSGRPDGRGFLVEVAAPEGEALNLKDLVADGGRINLYGRVVNQAGLIQANTVRENNGRIELVASEQVNLKSGSRIEAKGADVEVSDGGSVLAWADKHTGRTQFEAGAVIDASGGTNGGNGGTVELSGRDVNLGGHITVRATEGFRGGKVLIDPVFVNLFAVSVDGASELEFSSIDEDDPTFEDDLIVTGTLDLTFLGALPPGQEGTVLFTSGRDLLFNDAYIFNDPANDGSGTTAWHYTATARQDIVLTSSWLWTGLGGRLELDAGRDIRLLQGIARSYLWSGPGSDISLRAGRDLIAPSAFDPNLQVNSGIRLEGSGDLEINVGRDFVGGSIDGGSAGPGFLLSDGTARVAVGGDIGTQQSYADLTLGRGVITVAASGDIYLGLVQDKGLAEGSSPAVTINPTNQVHLTSDGGDIHLKPLTRATGDFDQLRQYYPASFAARALQGSIFVNSNLAFWPSLEGNLTFLARDTIQGLIKSDGFPSVVQLIAADPQTLIGPLTDSSTFRIKLNTPAQNVPEHEPATVSLRTETGDIRTFYFDLYSPSLHKSVDISAGRDLKEFVAHISVPEEAPAMVSANGDIDMTRPSTVAGADSGLHFHGPGTGMIRAGGTLDVANSEGITHQLLRFPSSDRNAGGLLDIGVGGDLEMIKSRIVSHNGAAISIHGVEGPDSPLGGTVNVGTSANAGGFGVVLGIVTLRGGGIAIKSTGNVEVNLSRVATFGGGDITIASGADINAGSGGRNERVEFVFEQRDENGNVVIDPRTGQPVRLAARVPGSGIFTFHSDDPDPLPPFPTTVDSPELRRLYNPILALAFLGRDVPPSLQAQYSALYAQELKQEVAEFIEPLKLGNIYLEAEEDVVVPPAGIRGREVIIKARDLILEGGQVQGSVQLDVDSIVGDLGSIVGSLSGVVGGAVAPPPQSATTSLSLGLSGSTGNLATSVSASTVAEAAEEVRDSGATNSPEDELRGMPSGDGEDEKKPVRSVRLKRGVTIEVQVSPDNLSQN